MSRGNGRSGPARRREGDWGRAVKARAGWRLVAAGFGLAAGCLIGPRVQGFDFHPDFQGTVARSEDTIKGDVLSRLGAPPSIDQVQVGDEPRNVNVCIAPRLIEQAAYDAHINGSRWLDGKNFGGFLLEFLEGNLHGPTPSSFVLREDDICGRFMRYPPRPRPTGLFRRWSGSNDEYIRLEKDVFGGRGSKVLIGRLEVEPSHVHALASADVGVGYGRELQPGARRGDQLSLGGVGLPPRLDSLFVSLSNGFPGGSEAVLSSPERQEQEHERGGGGPGAYEGSDVGPERQPVLPRPLYPALGAILLASGGWWSGRCLILGRVVGHAVGWLGGFLGTVLLLLGLANLFAWVLP